MTKMTTHDKKRAQMIAQAGRFGEWYVKFAKQCETLSAYLELLDTHPTVMNDIPTTDYVAQSDFRKYHYVWMLRMEGVRDAMWRKVIQLDKEGKHYGVGYFYKWDIEEDVQYYSRKRKTKGGAK